jgi:HEAT repeat protein
VKARALRDRPKAIKDGDGRWGPSVRSERSHLGKQASGGRSVNARIARVESASDVPGKSGLELLLKGARDPSSSVRAAAINSLAWRKDREALAAIRVALDDDDELVRLAAVEALGIRRHFPSRQRLVEVLVGDVDPLVRAYAASSLGEIGGAQRSLRAALEKEQSEDVRLRILAALGRGGRRTAVFDAIGYCWSEDYRVRCSAVNLLVDLVEGDDLSLLVLVLQRLSMADVSYAVRDTARRALRSLSSALE